MNGRFNQLALGLAFLASLTFLPNPASSQPAEDPTATVVRKWGLLGPWSYDCTLPPDHANGTVLDYEIGPDGKVLHQRDFGDVKDENPVVAADVSADGLLNLQIFFPALKQTREFGLRMETEGSMRTIYNRSEKGDYTIKDGKFVTTHKPTPILHHCE